MSASRHRGFFGPCKGTPLNADAIARLSTGDKVEVVWVGGNGPHVYEVRNDLDLWELYRNPRAVSADKLLESARFVALVSTTPEAN